MRSAVTTSRRRFSQEFKDELCQEVISTSKRSTHTSSHSAANWKLTPSSVTSGSQSPSPKRWGWARELTTHPSPTANFTTLRAMGNTPTPPDWQSATERPPGRAAPDWAPYVRHGQRFAGSFRDARRPLAFRRYNGYS